MDFKKILLGVIVVIILYLVYVYVFKDGTSSTLYSGGNAKNAVQIKATKLPGNKASVDFTFCIWIYVDNWQYRYGEEKVIFRRVDANGNASPMVALGSATNDLSVSMTVFNADGKGGATPTQPWQINNIPIQKWVNIIIRVQNRTIDIYLNGVLTVRDNLSKIIKQNYGDIFVGDNINGMNGFISSLRYFDYGIGNMKIQEIMQEGPNLKMIGDQNLQTMPPYLATRWYLDSIE